MLAAQCEVARAILKWSMADLAAKAGVPETVIAQFEGGSDVDDGLLVKVQNAFETAGVEFTFGDRPGVKIRTLDGIIEVSAGHTPHPKH